MEGKTTYRAVPKEWIKGVYYITETFESADGHEVCITDIGVKFSGPNAKARADHYAQIMNNCCIAKLKPGEPFFVLRGQDKLAPNYVRQWAREADILGASTTKTDEALAKATAMENWPYRKIPD